jgi:hypothetical protein
MQINFEIIPQERQRYDTVGDYWLDEKGVWQFRVSQIGNRAYEIAIFLHELVEWQLTQMRGITEEEISRFDFKFENLRKANPQLIGDHEPGDMKTAPYHKEHVFATNLERQFIEEMGFDWENYDEEVDNL